MDQHSNGRRTLIGCLAIIVLIVMCGAVTVLTYDQLCYTTLSRRLPVYPGAVVRVQRYNLLRPLGMGETYMELVSADDPDTVSRWYGATAGQYQREAIRANDFTYRLATAERSIVRAEDGSGSFIQLFGRCGQ